jgi:hypothetical protein
MAEVPERLRRQQEFVPTEARDLLSVDAHRYTDAVPAEQAKFAANPVYNGSDAERRYREHE